MPTRDYVTIVSGLPRSGTSLMMQMIHHGGINALTDNVRTADEDNPRGYFEFEPVKKTRQDPSWLGQAVGRSVKLVHLLLLDLPVTGYFYRVVFMRRNLDEVITSQDIMLARKGKTPDAAIASKLREIYLSQIADVHRHMREHAGVFAAIEVNYNELLAQPKREITRVSGFLGELDEPAMLAQIDPGLYRNRKS